MARVCGQGQTGRISKAFPPELTTQVVEAVKLLETICDGPDPQSSFNHRTLVGHDFPFIEHALEICFPYEEDTFFIQTTAKATFSIDIAIDTSLPPEERERVVINGVVEVVESSDRRAASFSYQLTPFRAVPLLSKWEDNSDFRRDELTRNDVKTIQQCCEEACDLLLPFSKAVAEELNLGRPHPKFQDLSDNDGPDFTDLKF